eukprot:TRINITY_DN13424_c0_g1_i1.p1 TRINITY_DN13424_c0_g1~~TRINITY_DN13424_c0_g1_i1.p1  ORF type:complete len:145 (-),score=6.15 TRINITY_DN13424_c0_g1_i1:33-467(-)
MSQKITIAGAHFVLMPAAELKKLRRERPAAEERPAKRMRVEEEPVLDEQQDRNNIMNYLVNRKIMTIKWLKCDPAFVEELQNLRKRRMHNYNPYACLIAIRKDNRQEIHRVLPEKFTFIDLLGDKKHDYAIVTFVAGLPASLFE